MFYSYKPFAAASAELLADYKEYFTLSRDSDLERGTDNGEFEQSKIDNVERIYAERRASVELRVLHEKWWREDNPNWKNRPWYALPEDVPPEVMQEVIRSVHQAWRGGDQPVDPLQP